MILGGSINTRKSLEALRFCTHVVSSLIISLSGPADFSALTDITTIEGKLINLSILDMEQIRFS